MAAFRCAECGADVTPTHEVPWFGRMVAVPNDAKVYECLTCGETYMTASDARAINRAVEKETDE